MSYRVFASIALATIMAAPSLVRAEDYSSDISTDRPDFTEGATVVPQGTMQLESGFTLEQFPGDLSTVAVGEFLIRKSLNEKLELRLRIPSYKKFSNGSDVSGLGDGSVGVKYLLGPTKSGVDVGVIVQVSIPTLSDVSSNELDPSAFFAIGKELNEKWSFRSHFGVGWVAGDMEWGASAGLGTSLGGTWGGVLELATNDSESRSAATLFHAGVTYVFKNGYQIDYHLGYGLSDSAPDLLIGAGLSFRL